NRLVGVARPGDSWAYEYDVFGNRAAAVHNGERTEYLIDPFGTRDVVAEYAGGGLLAHYAHGLGLAHRRGAGGAAGCHAFGAPGSTAGLSGAGGAYLNRYSYLPYGEAFTATEAVANPFQLVGQSGVMHEGNGLSFMRARFYSPSEGRFLSQD